MGWIRGADPFIDEVGNLEVAGTRGVVVPRDNDVAEHRDEWELGLIQGTGPEVGLGIVAGGFLGKRTLV